MARFKNVNSGIVVECDERTALGLSSEWQEVPAKSEGKGEVEAPAKATAPTTTVK